MSSDPSNFPPHPTTARTCPRSSPSARSRDWGRSERVEQALDKTLYDFLYHYWFRVTVEGIENVPATGGALLVSNHAGALPPDAAMIAKAIKTEHSRPRPLHLTVEHFFKGYPGLSMLVAKLGGVPAHPANVHRLLYDEEQLVLVFPEGRKGTEKLYKDRYQLRSFGRGGFVESAMKAQGADRPRRGGRRRGGDAGLRPHQPAQEAHRPHLLPGRRRSAYLPAKFHIRFLEPIPTDQWGDEPWEDKGLVQTVAEEVRGRIQEELYTMLAGRRSRSGSDEPRSSSPASRRYWGGRLAQVLERDPANEAIIGVSPKDPALPLERTEYVRVGTQHALLRRIVHAAEIDTVIDTRLVVDSKIVPARVAHEMNVLGTMNILAACGGPDSPVTKFVFKSSAHYYGCERDDPSFFTEEMQRPHPPRTRLESDIVEAEDAVQEFAARNAKVTVTTLRFCNGLGPGPGHDPQRAAEPAGGARDPRLRPALPVHPRGRHRRRAAPRGRQHDLPGIYNAAPDGVLALSEVASLLGKPYAPLLPPFGTGLASRRAPAGSG